MALFDSSKSVSKIAYAFNFFLLFIIFEILRFACWISVIIETLLA